MNYVLVSMLLFALEKLLAWLFSLPQSRAFTEREQDRLGNICWYCEKLSMECHARGIRGKKTAMGKRGQIKWRSLGICTIMVVAAVIFGVIVGRMSCEVLQLFSR